MQAWKLQHSDILGRITRVDVAMIAIVETTAMTICDNLWFKNWSNFEANSLGAGSGEGHSYASETNFRWNSQGEFVGIGELYGKLKRSWPFFFVKSFCWKTSLCLVIQKMKSTSILMSNVAFFEAGHFNHTRCFICSAGAVVSHIFFGFMVPGKDRPLGWFGYRYV